MKTKLTFAVATLTLALVAILSTQSIDAGSPETNTGIRVSGPYSHHNLAVYLLHGSDRIDTEGILTLDEAIADGKAVVRETGEVNRLVVENLADADLFLFAGDIVKGGRQDRVLVTDLVVPKGAQPMPIDAFCVEQGRWSGRGNEQAGRFSSAKDSLATHELRLAARKTARQDEVWGEVSKAQEALGVALGKSVSAPTSPSSLQLTLEDPEVRSRASDYQSALEPLLAEHTDALGYALVVDGRVTDIELFGSAALFRKVWPKMLRANAIEALASADERKEFELPKPAAIVSMLDTVNELQSATDARGDGVRRERKETDEQLYLGTWDEKRNGYVRESILTKNKR